MSAFFMAKPEAGDSVLIKTEKGEEQGIFLESHEPGILLLKLNSGYNIGIKKKDIKKIKILKRAEKEKAEEGKIKMSGKPIVEMIVTGGTISSSLDVKTGAVKWLTSPSQLFRFYPGMFEKIDVRLEKPFMKASENMDSGDWIKLARITAKALNDHNVQGVIISHGTDFLHYTASALSFMLRDLNKPVVLTYSQRSTDRGSSDAQLNLLCSAQAVLSDIAEVVLVGHAGINDNFCYALRGTKVRKMHTSRRDTFRAINCKPLAKIWADKIEIIGEHKKRQKSKVKVDAVFEDKVALVKFYPGQEPDILDYYLKKKYKGIVIEMSGLGHVITEGNKNWIPKLKELIKKGVTICAACQTLYGRLDPYVYSPGRELQELGIIYLEDMLPETALVKLGWILGHKEIAKNREKIKEMMLKNISHEFNERLGNEFLE